MKFHEWQEQRKSETERPKQDERFKATGATTGRTNTSKTNVAQPPRASER